MRSTRWGLLPETRNALDGSVVVYDAARVHAMVGDKGRLLAELARVRHIPCFWMAPHLKRIDPYLFALHGNPRFEALLNDPKNNGPLF